VHEMPPHDRGVLKLVRYRNAGVASVRINLRPRVLPSRVLQTDDHLGR
jgi:hypothetical protein